MSIEEELDKLVGRTVRVETDKAYGNNLAMDISVVGELEDHTDDDTLGRSFFVRVVDNFYGASGVSFRLCAVEEVSTRCGCPDVVVLKEGRV